MADIVWVFTWSTNDDSMFNARELKVFSPATTYGTIISAAQKLYAASQFISSNWSMQDFWNHFLHRGSWPTMSGGHERQDQSTYSSLHADTGTGDVVSVQ